MIVRFPEYGKNWASGFRLKQGALQTLNRRILVANEDEWGVEILRRRETATREALDIIYPKPLLSLLLPSDAPKASAKLLKGTLPEAYLYMIGVLRKGLRQECK